jgi:hypothetical protein
MGHLSGRYVIRLPEIDQAIARCRAEEVCQRVREWWR